MEGNKRLAFAYLLANHPETFDKIEKDNVILFHGTRSDALPNILKYGMNSNKRSNEEGIEVTTGEKSTSFGEGRDFISFTDDVSTAVRYANIPSKNKLEQREDFGVVIGISSDSLKQLKRCSVASDLPEIGIRDHMSVEHIKMLMVPPEKVDMVKKMVGEIPIEVKALDIEAPFYNMIIYDMEYGGIVDNDYVDEILNRDDTLVKFANEPHKTTEEQLYEKNTKGIGRFFKNIKSRIEALFGKSKDVKLLGEQVHVDCIGNSTNKMFEHLHDTTYLAQSSEVIGFDNAYQKSEIEEQDLTREQ